jgi:hypothetical protein
VTRAFLALLLTACAARPVEVRLAVAQDGRPREAWLAAIRPRHEPDALVRALEGVHPLTPLESRWLARFRQVAPLWAADLPRLEIAFAGLPAPRPVVILAGNVGGDDGFTSDERTIAVDLSAWARQYGEPGTAENDARLRRILSHEYTHLMTRAWRARHPVSLATPLERATWECFYEGLGNLRSLSAKWIAPDGSLTPHARQVEARLAPIFAERMRALAASPPPDEEARLTADLSRGAFDRKWGALLVALWLADETRGDERALAAWVDAGPAGIARLAEGRLPR